MQAIGFLPPDLDSKLYSLSALHVTKLTAVLCLAVNFITTLAVSFLRKKHQMQLKIRKC